MTIQMLTYCWSFSYLLDPVCDAFLSPSYHRAYLDVKELKSILRLDGSTHLNIFFANSSEEELAGVATWPWDKEALLHLGESGRFPPPLTDGCGEARKARMR